MNYSDKRSGADKAMLKELLKENEDLKKALSEKEIQIHDMKAEIENIKSKGKNHGTKSRR